MRRGGKLGQHQLQHPVIDQPDQSKLLGDRHDVRCEHQSIIMAHAHQALVECRLARVRLHHRFEGDDEAAVVQRGDDLVSDTNVDAPLRFTLDIRQPRHERAGASRLGRLQRFLRAACHIVGGAGIARHVDAADRDRHGHRSRFRRHDLVANAGEKPLRRGLHVLDRAVLQDQAELVAREAAEHVTAAQPRTQADGDFADDLVGDIEAERIVDPGEMIDGDDHERERRAKALRFLDRLGKRRDQPRAIELAGQRILLGQLHQLFVTRMPLVDRAHHAVRAHRPAVGAGKPAAGFLDPGDRRGGRKPQAVLDGIGNALAALVGRRIHNRVAANRRLRFDALGQFCAAGDRLGRKVRQQRRDARAPCDGIGSDVPDELGMLERCQNAVGLKLT
jgi:hypothetical protein